MYTEPKPPSARTDNPIPSELEDLVIRASEGGAEVRLRELGRVVDLFDEPSERIELGGRRAGRLEEAVTQLEHALHARRLDDHSLDVDPLATDWAAAPPRVDATIVGGAVVHEVGS